MPDSFLRDPTAVAAALAAAAGAVLTLPPRFSVLAFFLLAACSLNACESRMQLPPVVLTEAVRVVPNVPDALKTCPAAPAVPGDDADEVTFWTGPQRASPPAMNVERS